VSQHVATRDLGGLADDIVNIFNFLSYLICFTYIAIFRMPLLIMDMLLLFTEYFFGNVCCDLRTYV
jgi:hypothetical protein